MESSRLSIPILVVPPSLRIHLIALIAEHISMMCKLLLSHLLLMTLLVAATIDAAAAVEYEAHLSDDAACSRQ